MRLIDADALREKALSDKDLITWTYEYGDAIPLEWIMSTIDNAPAVETDDERPQGAEQQNKQDIKSCLYRSENSECELASDDCFPDDIPWNCPFGKGGKE